MIVDAQVPLTPSETPAFRGLVAVVKNALT